jgi:hypothetical protein
MFASKYCIIDKNNKAKIKRFDKDTEVILFKNLSISQWIDLIDKDASVEFGIPYKKLEIKSYPYENYLYSFLCGLSAYSHFGNSCDIEILSYYIHEGWSFNYLYWRDNKPWLNNTGYIEPEKMLGDSVRDTLSLTPYNDLSEKDKDKDRIIARILYRILTKKEKIE